MKSEEYQFFQQVTIMDWKGLFFGKKAKLWEVSDDNEATKHILNLLVKDEYYTKRFAGKIKNGTLKGYFGYFARPGINGSGSINISGTYDLEKGDLSLSGTQGSNVTFTMILVPVIILGLNIFYLIYDLENFLFWIPIVSLLVAILHNISVRWMVRWEFKKFTDKLRSPHHK
ncbi:MAG: hypothetical protein SchgKO_16630 [Schleiferiaceae bacterium]